ncbi:DUF4190 domain-containing protein [Gracilibacillus caseinilyticus]|uniref:DUF4190 domain-containing protein n=1 Tax=Gracilibacillus caseinilyticus TaxID=2932256 RepID=A0ABY4ET42_9BACI|nr:DUF4190 domain-containing protein [Gracilibacillus caseinilyticus]UOQ47434.1 DUF4190 domain-containing protein [Gracilibacillus caseinilyticus]
MPNHQDEQHVENAPKIDNGHIDESPQSKQFVATDELYAVDEAYKREAETSAELSASEFNRPVASDEQETEMQTNVNPVYGWIGLIAAIASFFVWPLIMAIGAIVLGFISKKQGADTLGNSAIAIGIISIILSMILIPF